jgi:hypothetical protein
MEITFTDVTSVIPKIYHPQPAIKKIPDWYKDAPSYIDNEKKPDGYGRPTQTIKKCMPVFDAMSSGYLIFSYTDIFVSQKDGYPWYEWPSMTPIEYHAIEQAPNHPNQNGTIFPKWVSPWCIKTPPGYSCLFLSPLHRESIFTTFSGIVDTDIYTGPVSFPFVLNDVKFTGLIPAGTPIVQVIPFKRDSWEMNIGDEEERKDQSKAWYLLRSKFFDSYKINYRQNKEYK